MNNKPKSLIVISSANSLPLKTPKDTSVSVGFFIVEMAKILQEFKDEYEFVFATPDGQIPTIDINGEALVMQTASKFLTSSVKLTAELNINFDLDKYREHNLEYVNRRNSELQTVSDLLGKLKVSEVLPKTNKEAKIFRGELLKIIENKKEHKFMSLKEIIEKDDDKNDSFKISDFKFVHMPGGHAPMVDFVDNPYLGELLNRIHKNKIILSLICHAPIALSSAKFGVNMDGSIKKIEDHAYKGAHVTVFGKVEELEVSMGGFYHVPGEKTRLTYYASDKLNEDGYNVDTTVEFLPNVIWDEDKLLLTGNGPQSIDVQAKKLKEILK
ncbi:MAG: hypothetical protein ACRCXA_07235 [Peptostreptococcaceae bacterium]